MSIYDIISKYPKTSIMERAESTTDSDVLRTLSKDSFSDADFLNLISPAASKHIERMAMMAQRTTLRHFGKTISLYAPLYLSNYCVNTCVYCGYNHSNDISRKSLTISEMKSEMKSIHDMGIRHILLLTGECKTNSSVEYISDAVKNAKELFPSVSIEVYPLETREYAGLVESGADGLTIYQEVYDETIYADMHPKGPKRNYRFRLDAAERGCIAGMRTVGIGALLGLDSPISESFYLYNHALYLMQKYPEVDLSLSLPRMQPCAGGFDAPFAISDREWLQTMLALRIVFPHAGITVSTRESPYIRDNIVGLGVTRMSAGSVTEVGGYSGDIGEKGEEQFEISDDRSVDDFTKMIYSKGFQPVFKDWHPF